MKFWFRTTILWFIVIFAAWSFWFLIDTFFEVYDRSVVSYNTSDWENIGTYLNGIGGPVISFWSLLLTTWIAYEFNQYQKEKQKENDSQDLQQTTIELFKELRSPRMLRARNTAVEIVKQWRRDESGNFLKKFVERMLVEQPGNCEGFDVQKRHIQAVFDMLSFYNMLSLYSGNYSNIKNLNYFFYGWWRAFLYAVAFEFDDNRKVVILRDLKQHADFKSEFINNVQYVNSLRRLDALCGFDVLKDNGAPSEIVDFYPGTDFC